MILVQMNINLGFKGRFIFKGTQLFNDPMNLENENLLEGNFPMEEDIPRSPLVSSRRKFSKEDLEFDMSSMNKVAEKIFKQGLDALASAARQINKLKNTRVVEKHPSEVEIPVNNEFFVPNTTRGYLSMSIKSSASHSISLLSIISQLLNQLTLE